MADLEKLVKDHAYYSALKRRLKAAGEVASDNCVRTKVKSETLEEAIEALRGPQALTCIQVAYKEWREAAEEALPFDEAFFEDVWEEMVAEGTACESCQSVRKLKAQRIAATRRLAQVRSGITKAGLHLLKKEEEQ